MDLFIKVNNSNVPEGHPILKTNLKQVFPNLDWDAATPPSGWLKYIKVTPPEPDPYKKFDESIGADLCAAFQFNGLERKLIDGELKEVWHLIDMTAEEMNTKQDLVKSDWASLDPAGPSSWSFNETTCQYEPPVVMPTDGKEYYWDEDTTSWKTTDLGLR